MPLMDKKDSDNRINAMISVTCKKMVVHDISYLEGLSFLS